MLAQSGEFVYQQKAFEILGRAGKDVVVDFTYGSHRSGVPGNMGRGWRHSFENRLSRDPTNNNITVENGYGRSDTFVFNAATGQWADGPGLYKMVREEANWIYIRNRYGDTEVYYATNGLLDRTIDRHGNTHTVRYTPRCNVRSVTDVFGRAIMFDQRELRFHPRPRPGQGGVSSTALPDIEERLVAITDFTGRKVELEYCQAHLADCSEGDLVALKSPGVQTSPRSANSFGPKVTRFTYDVRQCDVANPPPTCRIDELFANLLTVTPPGETAPTVRNLYGDNQAQPETFDRVTTQSCGDAALAGANRTSHILYEKEACTALWVTYIDRNRHKHRHHLNALGHHDTEEHYTGHSDPSGTIIDRNDLRPLQPTSAPNAVIEGSDWPVYVTTYQRNADGEITAIDRPDGSRTINTYYTPARPDDPADSIRRGNLLREVSTPGPLGGEQTQLETSFTYEPVYNQRKTSTSKRGHTTTYSYDYELHLAGATQASVEIRDVDRSGRAGDSPWDHVRGGGLARVVHPAVNSVSAQEEFRYNQFGQEVWRLDAEGNEHETSYYPHTAPSGAAGARGGRPSPVGTGGYRAQTRSDVRHRPGANHGGAARPAVLTEDFVPDELGRVIERTDGRGVIYRVDYNELDQIWRERRAVALSSRAAPHLAPLSYEVINFYDARDRLVQVNKTIANPDIRDIDSPKTPFDDTGYASVAFTYDHWGNKTGEIAEVVQTGANSASVQHRVWRYDGNDNVIEIQSPEAVAGTQSNNRTKILIDEFDRPFKTIRAPSTPAEQIVEHDYHFTSTDVTLAIDGRRKRTLNRYDGYGRLRSTRDALGGVRERKYDPAGNQLAETFVGDPGPVAPGQTPIAGSRRSPVKLFEKQLVYDERDRPTEVRTHVLIAAHPLLGRAEQSLGWAVEKTTFDRMGRTVATTNANGHTTRIELDGMGRAVKTTDAVGNIVKTVFDENGNVTETREEEIDPNAAGNVAIYTTRHEHDALDRIVRTTDPDGNVSHQEYDGLGNLTVTIDRNGNVDRHYYDLLARRIRSERILTATGLGPGGSASGTPDPTQGGGDGIISRRTEYDLNDRTVAHVDDAGNRTVLEYGDRDQLRRVTYPGGNQTWIYDHDAAGNIERWVDPNGTVVKQAFDDLNRLVETRVTPRPGNPHRVTGTTAEDRDYDGLSRLARISDNNGAGDDVVLGYTYDGLARVIEEHQSIAGQVLSVRARHDAVGNATAVTYPSGRLVDRTYDANERLETINEASARLATYRYAGRGRLRGRDHTPTGSSLSVEHDRLRRPRAQRHTQGATVTAHFEYGYDREDNRLFDRGVHDGNRGKVYAYDGGYRLRGTRYGVVGPSASVATPDHTETLTLDGEGNRLVRTYDTQTTSYTPNNLNQYTAVGASSWTYDNNGNATDDGDRRFEFDFRNRLVRVTRAGTGANLASYLYDGSGRRVRKAVSTGETRFVWRGTQVVEERKGAEITTFVHGAGVDELIERTSPTRRVHFIDDVQGNVVAIADTTGVIERYAYSPFGAPTVLEPDGRTVRAATLTETDNLFTGREWDAEVGLYYFRARFYDPAIGRFIQRDPEGFAEGLNLYLYALGNPVSRVDPLGTESWKEWASGWVDFGKSMLTDSAYRSSVVDNADQWATAGGAHIVANTLTYGATDKLGLTHSDQYQGSTFAASRTLANVAQTALETAAGGGAAGKLVKGALDLKDKVEHVQGLVEAAQDLTQGDPTGALMELGGALISRVGSRPGRAGAGGGGGGGGAGGRGAGPRTSSCGPSGCGGPGLCFVAGTKIAVAGGDVAIESLRVGDRVRSTGGSSATTVDASWLRVELDMPNPHATHDQLQIVLLRPISWLAMTAKGEVYLRMDEIGVAGFATVRSIAVAPPISRGTGRVVLGTVTHVNNNVHELSFVGSDVRVRPTGEHRLYSLDRADWVPTQELRIGERLQTEHGEVVVARVRKLDQPERVFNIEVESDNEYMVSALRIRSHNNDEDCVPLRSNLTPRDRISEQFGEGAAHGMHRTTPQQQGRQGRAENLPQYEAPEMNYGASVRGWMAQERVRIERARRRGEVVQPRTPPGYVQAHDRGTEAHLGFGYEGNSKLNLAANNQITETVARRHRQ